MATRRRDLVGPSDRNIACRSGQWSAFTIVWHKAQKSTQGDGHQIECSIQCRGGPLTSNVDRPSESVPSLIHEYSRPMNSISHFNQSPRIPSAQHGPSNTTIMYNERIFRHCELQMPISRPQMTRLRCYKLQWTCQRIRNHLMGIFSITTKYTKNMYNVAIPETHIPHIPMI